MKKKIVTAALVSGFLLVPSLAFAQHGADDVNSATDVRQEDRQADRQEDRQQDRQEDRRAARQDQNVPADQQNATDDNDRNRGGNNDDDNVVSGVKVENETTVPSGSISLDEALSIAKNRMSGKTVEKVETENEHGAVVYSVRFTDNSRVDVRASDGAVTRERNRSND